MNFTGGTNIAMKVPTHQWEDTVAFYRDVIGLRQLDQHLPHVVFQYGPNQLWIDRVDALSQAEIWLELVASHLADAQAALACAGVARRDEVEALPPGFEGFWITNSAGIIHLVAARDTS